jgi:iron(III) transport system permease protein
LLAWSICLYASIILTLAFAMPVVQLVMWCIDVFATEFDSRYPVFILHSVLLSGMAAVLVVIVAMILAYSLRLYQDWPTKFFARLSTLGYAIPGTVLAVGVFIPVAWMDNQLMAFFKPWFNTGAILRGTLTVMLLAYVARFLAPGFNAIDSAMQRITRSQEEAARGMGFTGWRLSVRIFEMTSEGQWESAALPAVALVVVGLIPVILLTRQSER